MLGGDDDRDEGGFEGWLNFCVEGYCKGWRGGCDMVPLVGGLSGWLLCCV